MNRLSRGSIAKLFDEGVKVENLTLQVPIFYIVHDIFRQIFVNFVVYFSSQWWSFYVINIFHVDSEYQTD